MSEEEWIAALKLSTMWDFFNVRKLAIEALSRIEMNPITKILVGKQYMVRTFLFDGYYELAVGTGPISVAEAAHHSVLIHNRYTDNIKTLYRLRR
jgi:hypothetical protein